MSNCRTYKDFLVSLVNYLYLFNGNSVDYVYIKNFYAIGNYLFNILISYSLEYHYTDGYICYKYAFLNCIFYSVNGILKYALYSVYKTSYYIFYYY